MPCKRGSMPQVVQEVAFQISMQEQKYLLLEMYITGLEDEIAFLDTVTAKGKGQPGTVNLYLNNCLKEFKIDTGADVTVVPEKE